MKPRRFFGKLPRPIKLPAETGDERHVDGELSTNPVEGELSTDPACGEISTNLEENLKAISSLLGTRLT